MISSSISFPIVDACSVIRSQVSSIFVCLELIPSGVDVEVDEAHLRVSGEAVQVSAGIYINSQVSEMQCSMSATATLALRGEIVEVVPRNIGSML